MKLSIKKEDVKYFCAPLIYYILLNLVYIVYQVPLFGYVGYQFKFSFFKLLLGMVVYFVGVYVLKDLRDASSTTAIYLIFYLSIAPFIILYQYENMGSWMLAYMLFSLVILRLFVLFFQDIKIKNWKKYIPYCERRKSLYEYKKWSNTDGLINGLVVIVVGFCGLMLVTVGLPNFGLLSFEHIAEVRADATFDFVSNMVITLLCKIAIPLLLIIFLKNKKWGRLVIVTLAQLYLYSITGFKTYLFILLIVYALYIVRKLTMKSAIMFGLIAAMAGAVLLYMITQKTMVLALITNRVVFFPAKIKWAYLDFFSNHSFAFFSEGTIAKLFGIDAVYEQNIPNMIGGMYFAKPEMWANTGYMADAYANMGVFGGIIISAILAVELCLVDVVTSGKAKGLAAMFIVFYITFNDGGLISISVSGGFIFAILAYAILFKGKEENFNELI